jgi:hypothetical protein
MRRPSNSALSDRNGWRRAFAIHCEEWCTGAKPYPDLHNDADMCHAFFHGAAGGHDAYLHHLDRPARSRYFAPSVPQIPSKQSGRSAAVPRRDRRAFPTGDRHERRGNQFFSIMVAGVGEPLSQADPQEFLLRIWALTGPPNVWATSTLTPHTHAPVVSHHQFPVQRLSIFSGLTSRWRAARMPRPFRKPKKDGPSRYSVSGTQ